MNRIGKSVLMVALLVALTGFAFASGGAQQSTAAAAGPAKVTYWMDMASDKVAPVFKNVGDTQLYKEIMKKLNIQITFLHPPVGQGRDQFNLIIASQDLPDVMEWGLAGYPGGPAKAISDGVAINHNDVIAKHSPNLSALYKANPTWEKLAKTDDGVLYGYPFIRGDPMLMVFYGPVFRQDYLTELGLKVPATIDEWYTTLKALKEKKGIQYPFSFRQKGTGQDGNDFFTGGGLPGAWGVTRGFYLDEKKDVKFGPMEPGWKDFVTTMAKWYKEGLIDPDFPVQDLKTWRAKVMDGQAAVFLGYTGGGIGYFYDNVLKDNPKFKLIGSPNPVLKAGTKSRFGQMDWDVPTPSYAFITPKNKNVEASAKLLDFGYGKEGDMMMNFGIEGLSYKMVGNYPTYTDNVTKNPNQPMALAMSDFMRSHYAGPMVQRREYFEQFLKYPDQVLAVKNWSGSSDFSSRLPTTTPSPEESSKLATIMNEINVYTDEMLMKWLMGQASMDQWDSYVAQVKKMGIDQALDIQRAALARFNKR
jgi:putative aldouronate transport system substrate-binding protein